MRTRKKPKSVHFSYCVYLNDLFYSAEETNACNFAKDTTFHVADSDVNSLIKKDKT